MNTMDNAVVALIASIAAFALCITAIVAVLKDRNQPWKGNPK